MPQQGQLNIVDSWDLGLSCELGIPRSICKGFSFSGLGSTRRGEAPLPRFIIANLDLDSSFFIIFPPTAHLSIMSGDQSRDDGVEFNSGIIVTDNADIHWTIHGFLFTGYR